MLKYYVTCKGIWIVYVRDCPVMPGARRSGRSPIILAEAFFTSMRCVMRSVAQATARLQSVKVVNAGYRVAERLRSQTTVESKVSTSGDMVAQDLDAARKLGHAIKTKRNGSYLSLGSSFTQCEALKRKLRFLHKQLDRKRTDGQRRALLALIERDTAKFLELAKTVQANYNSLDGRI